MFGSGEFERFFKVFEEKTEKKIIKLLQYVGEAAVKAARENGNYFDQTGNLRSSIGYVVIKEGKRIKEDFEASPKGTDKQSGIVAAMKLATKAAQEHNTGLALIIVAGMDYAVCVEAIEGYDVITATSEGAEDFLKDNVKKIMKRVDKNC